MRIPISLFLSLLIIHVEKESLWFLLLGLIIGAIWWKLDKPHEDLWDYESTSDDYHTSMNAENDLDKALIRNFFIFIFLLGCLWGYLHFF